MSILKNVTKQTDNKFLNIYVAEYEQNKKVSPYFIASRKDTVEELDCVTGQTKADAAIIVPIYQNGDILFIKQFRKPVGRYVYEFPAGLIDSGESLIEGAKRELYEETGLKVTSITELLSPRYLSVGMSDESLGIYLARVCGDLSKDHQEESEEIEFEIVKSNDLMRFVTENPVTMQAALTAMYLYTLDI